MNKLFYAIILTLPVLVGQAQELPEELEGVEARNWIRTNYYDGEFRALTYSQARRKMFAYIANENDTIECVYSGLKKYLEEGDESTAYPAPFNTEHVVPQSLFNSDEPMRSDIYILQPCFEDWNSARSNYPFRELDDINETDRWYYLSQSTTTVPTQFIERYSELDNFTAWEPRENRKGDIARAILYFFTMYPGYNINNVIDAAELCGWHETDTVDAIELKRNMLTEVYQGNQNPYITWPHWANQAFGCRVPVPPPVVNGLDLVEAGLAALYPNPGNGRFHLELRGNHSFPLTGEIRDVNGKLHDIFEIKSNYIELYINNIEGLYYIILKDISGRPLGGIPVNITH
jgi:hypothetical protein